MLSNCRRKNKNLLNIILTIKAYEQYLDIKDQDRFLFYIEHVVNKYIDWKIEK